MSNFSDIIIELEKKIIQLIEQKKSLETEVETLRKSEAVLSEKAAAHEKIEKELREKNSILRIAGGNNEEGNREIKLKINEIVREVDKCIAQLNQ